MRYGLVLGGAREVWTDVAAVEGLIGGGEWPGLVVAANDIGCHWPRRLDGWCTLHPEKMAGWVEARRRNGHPDGFVTYARQAHNGVRPKSIQEVVFHPFVNGSSGLLAVTVAMEMGCDRIVLAGVPMTNTHYFSESEVHPEARTFCNAEQHWKQWLVHADQLAGVVRSMSGRTRRLLGAPTRAWLGL